MKIQNVYEIFDDVQHPKTKDDLPRWIMDVAIRFWDEPVLEALRKTLQSLKRSGTPYRTGALILFKQGQYDLARMVRRDVFSVRRSVKRLVAMGKVNFILDQVEAV
jgi:hypothetical protein